MPLCTIPFNPKDGPLLDIFISKPASLFGAAEAEASQRKVTMLIDTGASRTALSAKLAAELQLPLQGKVPMKSVTHEVQANLYSADLMCRLLSPPLALPDMTIMEFPLANSWRDGLLGRDFLENVILEINGPEKYFKLIV